MTAFEWALAKEGTTPPSEFYCQTSDVWNGRFSKVAPLLIKQGADDKFAALITAVVGEIGDNCFAHNTPNWIDMPGCWFEWSFKVGVLSCIIADRGRGILSSLKAVRPELRSDSEALLVALTERVSGRAPEKRGNGLKFTVEALHNVAAGSFILQSGAARINTALPLDSNNIKAYISVAETPVRGVYSELQTRIIYAS